MKPIFYTRHSLDKHDIECTKKILKGDWLTQGPLVSEFEDTVARFCKSRYGVAVNSGTSALHLATFAAGTKEGDEVITSPLSFAASANCILYQGGTPVFADIDYETGLLDPKEVEKKITKKTKAVITVDYGGHPSFFYELKKICRQYGLILIDDASHSLGALYKNMPVGSQADMTTFSFHPAKLITCGEGGVLVTNNKRFYERALLFRSHGIVKESKNFVFQSHRGKPWFYEMQELGYNYRIPDFQCALGIAQFKKIKKFLKARREIARYYTNQLRGENRFKLPQEARGCKSAWHLYPLRILDKNIKKERVFKRFQDKNIFPQVNFIPIHTHPYYQKNLGYKWGDFPKAEAFYEEEVSLPIHPALKQGDLKRAVGVLKDI